MSKTVTIPAADYMRMIEALELDDMVIWCEVCGAWMDRDDPARATTEDFSGCWKSAAGLEDDGNNCRSYRGTIIENARAALAAGEAK